MPTRFALATLVSTLALAPLGCGDAEPEDPDFATGQCDVGVETYVCSGAAFPCGEGQRPIGECVEDEDGHGEWSTECTCQDMPATEPKPKADPVCMWDGIPTPDEILDERMANVGQILGQWESAVDEGKSTEPSLRRTLVDWLTIKGIEPTTDDLDAHAWDISGS